MAWDAPVEHCVQELPLPRRVVRVVRLRDRLRIQADDGSSLVLGIGPRGQGIRITTPSPSGKATKPARPGDLSLARGRRPSQATLTLRQRLKRDFAAKRMARPEAYVVILEKAGIRRSAARQTVRREVKRMFGRRVAATRSRVGRPPSALALHVREVFRRAKPHGDLVNRAPLYSKLVSAGLSKKAAEAMVYREGCRARRLRAP